MTIISVVYVPEGIAMASDSRLTGERKLDNGGIERFSISDNAQKLVLLRNSTIGVSFCGDAIIEGKTVADFLRVFDIDQVEDTDTVTEVAEKLKQCLLNNYQNYNVAFLVAGFDDDQPFVYTVDKNAANRSNFNGEALSYGASWLGETEPVSKLFNQTPFDFGLMPLRDAIDMSEFIVEIAIKYYRFYAGISTCGGTIDSLVITKDFTKFIRHKILQP